MLLNALYFVSAFLVNAVLCWPRHFVFFCSTSLSRGNQVGGLPRALILEQIELVGQIGGSARIGKVLKKMKENVIHGHWMSHFILIIPLS